MAAPLLNEAYIKNGITIICDFDSPLDDDVPIPITSFSVNYGKIPIVSVEYYGTSKILLTVDRRITHHDKLELNYQPPEAVELAVRGCIASGSSKTIMRRNAVRAFYKVKVINQMFPDENAWSINSNLGQGKKFTYDPNHPDPEIDINFPGYDICGDGSIIIGNPGNIVDGRPGDDPDKAEGAIKTLGNLVPGIAYSSGIWYNVDLKDGYGQEAQATIVTQNGGVIQVILSAPGKNYSPGDVLSADAGQIGGTGTGFSITVETVNATVGATAAHDWGEIQQLPYPNIDRPAPRAATPDDFVLAYGLREAIQLTNIDNADATEPNTAKLWMAIEDACALIDNYIEQASRAGKLLISSNRRRTSLIIARYYLDTVRRREDVKKDYDQAISELDRAREMRQIQRPDLPWWLDPCNPNRGKGVRSHRIPQYYNGTNGKGFDGWWVDSAAEEGSDFRTDGTNSQNNNNVQNNVNTGDYIDADEQSNDAGGSLGDNTIP